jgi:hypothetical protein
LGWLVPGWLVQGSLVLGQDLKSVTSLNLAPVDADFYSGSMRLKDQWQRLERSKCVQELKKVDVVQRIVAQLEKEWKSGLGQVGQAKRVINNPLVQELIELAKDMFSDEVFLLGDAQVSKLLRTIGDIQNEIQGVIATDGPEGLQAWFQEWTADDANDIPVPMMVMGFRIQDKERALTLLDQLQGIAAAGMAALPNAGPLGEALERVEDQRGTRLTLTLSVDLVPWDELPADPDLAGKLRELLAERQIVLTMGQLDQWLVMGISEDADAIAQLGKTASLAENPLLAPLKPKATEKLTSVSFVSDALADAQFQINLKDYFSKIYRQIFPALVAAGELPDFLEPLEEDLRWLDDSMERLVPDFKGSLGYTYLSGRGHEGYFHSRTESVFLDGSKPLEVLKHTGEQPLLLWALREQYHPEWFELARQAVRKIRGYLENAIESDAIDDEESLAKINLFLDKGWPLLTKLADTWETRFLPATKDGQHACVVSIGNLSNRQWTKEMPPSDQPLALPEIAVVSSVNDQELLKQGFVDLFSICDELVTLVREINPKSVPEGYVVPRPQEQAMDRGTKYLYPIPEDCPVPKTMAPQAGLLGKWMIGGYSDAQVERLANAGNLRVGAGVIQPDKPMASAAYLDLGGIAKAATPWLRYGLVTNLGALDQPVVPANEHTPAILAQDILDVWSVLGYLGQVSSATTMEGKGTVTHWMVEY